MTHFTHIFQLLTHEWQTYTSSHFFLGGAIIFLTYFFAQYANKQLVKVFLLLLALMIFYEVFTSNCILYNQMFYVALGIIFSQYDLVVDILKLLKRPKKHELGTVSIQEVDMSHVEDAPQEKFNNISPEEKRRREEEKCQKKLTVDEILKELNRF